MLSRRAAVTPLSRQPGNDYLRPNKLYDLYSKAERSQLKQEFWTIFGKYISLHLSGEGERVNWVNYKTGFKHIRFRLQADTGKAAISIELTHPDPEVRRLFFEKFVELKQVFTETLQESWNWEEHAQDDNGQPVSRIGTELKPVNVLNKNDWPAIISFLKPRMIALDGFWNTAKLFFEEFRFL